MKKKYNKGFIFAETIVVSSVVIAALIIIYVQFISIINNYNLSFKYNSVNDMYLVDNINNYILTDGYPELKTSLESDNYVNITDCSYDYFTEYLYCKGLMQNIGVKTAIFTREDTTNLVNTLDGSYSTGLKKFISKLNTDNEANRYRVIVEFENGTFASVKIDEVSR